MKNPISNERLAEMAGWRIADAMGCEYSGDANPIQHGGLFFDPRDWEAYGYASCVEFWEDPETGHLVVQRATVNRLDGEDMERAFRCCGIDGDDRGSILAQIEACRSYADVEVEGTAHPYLKTFDLETWCERNIWKSVRGWLEELSDPERVRLYVRRQVCTELGLSTEAPDYAIADLREERGLPRDW